MSTKKAGFEIKEGTGQNGLQRFFLIVLGTVLLTGAGLAGNVIPNVVPYLETFNGFAEGEYATNLWASGWSGSASDISMIITKDFDFDVINRPIEPDGWELGNKVLQLDTGGGMLTNAFDMADGEFPKLYLDLMVNFAISEQYPTEMLGDESSKLALFLNSHSNLVVFHGGVDGNEEVFTVLSNVVDEVWVPTRPGEWYRLTVEMDMAVEEIVFGDTYYYSMFRTLLNGEVIGSEVEGFEDTDVSLPYDGGSWFRFANLGTLDPEDNYNKVSALSFRGTGMIDDLVLTYATPVYEEPLAMWWVRSVLVGSGERTPATDFPVLPGTSTQVVYSAEHWYEIKSLETNAVPVPEAVGQTIYTAKHDSVAGDISNHVVFGVIEIDVSGDMVPATWYEPIFGWDPDPLQGEHLSLYQAYLLNQDNLDAPFVITAIGLDEDNKVFVEWLSYGAPNGVVEIYSTDDLSEGFEPDPIAGVNEGWSDGTNTWRSEEPVADLNRFYRAKVVAP